MCRFSLLEIRSATNNFDESLVIRIEEFGRVYKVDHESVSIEISRLCVGVNGVFRRDIKVFSEVRHRNIVSFIGYCSERGENILVYEHVPLGTLADHLYRGKAYAPLSWGQRLKICIGIARGLDYLHTGISIEKGLLHLNVRSENILLDENWEAKIGGLGLSKVMVRGEDPEFVRTGKLTRNSDVYSFGVVLVEALSGRVALATVAEQEQQQNLVELEKQSIREGRLNQIIDPRMRRQILFGCLEEFAKLAGQCLHIDPEKRPKVSEVVSKLEGLLEWEEREIVDTGGPSSSLDIGDSIIEEKDAFGTNKDAWNQEVQTLVCPEVIDARTTQSDRKSVGKMTFRGKISMYLGIPHLVSATSGSNRWRRKPNFAIFSAMEPTVHRFLLAEIQSATHHFDEELTIGEGGFWKVYKGTIFDGSKPKKSCH